MKQQSDEYEIARQLLDLDPLIERERFFEVLEAGAAELALTDPFAFLLASCLDRGAPSKVIWTIPLWLQRQWGHLDPTQIRRMTNDHLVQAVDALPRRPRYRSAAPLTIGDLAAIVTDEYSGDAQRLWYGRRPAELRAALQRIRGVGPGIANMAVQLVERVFPGELETGGEAALDIKPDVHTRRVLSRLGQMDSDAAAVAAARRMHPTNPGRLDGPLWYVGHVWCHARLPECRDCFLANLCPRNGL